FVTLSLKVTVIQVYTLSLHDALPISLGNYTYTPSLNYNGSDMVVFNVCDRGTPLPVTCANDTLFITVNPVNDAPVLDNENLSTNEDTPARINFRHTRDSYPDTTVLTT